MLAQLVLVKWLWQQDSQDDARAEGVIAASGPMEAGLAFRELWDSIYGEESWKANPWVWVIEFKRVEGGAA